MLMRARDERGPVNAGAPCPRGRMAGSVRHQAQARKPRSRDVRLVACRNFTAVRWRGAGPDLVHRACRRFGGAEGDRQGITGARAPSSAGHVILRVSLQVFWRLTYARVRP